VHIVENAAFYLVTREVDRGRPSTRLPADVTARLERLHRVVADRLGDDELTGLLAHLPDAGVLPALRRSLAEAALDDDAFRRELEELLSGLPVTFAGELRSDDPMTGAATDPWRHDDIDRGAAESSPDIGDAPVRHLIAQMPDRAGVGRRIPLIVTVAPAPYARSGPLAAIDVPPEGRSIVIAVSAPTLHAIGDLEQDLVVPADGESAPVRFGFVTGPTGLHHVDVRAFAGGRFLGQVRLEISVEPGVGTTEPPPRRTELAAVSESTPGEVTLQVNREGTGLSFQLIGDSWHRRELVASLAGDPAEVVERTLEELRRMAIGQAGYDSPAMVRRRLAALGANLWRDLVPSSIKRQFWEQIGRISSFVIMGDLENVPWELLYAVDGDHELGFLAEHLPVVRRAYDHPPVHRLSLSSIAFVVPPYAPTDAADEVERVRRLLGPRVDDRGVIDGLQELIDMLDDPPSVLHFACHNSFTRATGSAVTMRGGPIGPVDLELARQRKALAASAPLVFLNACRTAGEISGFTELSGWASQFMAAGAGCFAGTLWPVRSAAAREFAAAFYDALVHERLPLGEASLLARRTIADDLGDPTWLAYSIYGSPTATVAR
jgi:hypothetical protein